MNHSIVSADGLLILPIIQKSSPKWWSAFMEHVLNTLVLNF